MRNYNIRTAAAVVLSIRVLVVPTPVSSLSFQVRHTWYLVRYVQSPNRLCKSEVRGSVSRLKTPCGQGLPHYTYVLQADQRVLVRRRRRRSAVSPWNMDPLRSTTLHGIRSARSGLGLCPKPKVVPRFSLGDVRRSVVAAVAQMDRYESYLARYGTR